MYKNVYCTSHFDNDKIIISKLCDFQAEITRYVSRKMIYLVAITTSLSRNYDAVWDEKYLWYYLAFIFDSE